MPDSLLGMKILISM